MIVSSTVSVGHLQACGRSYVIERHTDDLGTVYEREYLAPANADYAAIAAAQAVQLAVELAEAEFEDAINGS